MSVPNRIDCVPVFHMYSMKCSEVVDLAGIVAQAYNYDDRLSRGASMSRVLECGDEGVWDAPAK